MSLEPLGAFETEIKVNGASIENVEQVSDSVYNIQIDPTAEMVEDINLSATDHPHTNSRSYFTVCEIESPIGGIVNYWRIEIDETDENSGGWSGGVDYGVRIGGAGGFVESGTDGWFGQENAFAGNGPIEVDEFKLEYWQDPTSTRMFSWNVTYAELEVEVVREMEGDFEVEGVSIN